MWNLETFLDQSFLFSSTEKIGSGRFLKPLTETSGFWCRPVLQTKRPQLQDVKETQTTFYLLFFAVHHLHICSLADDGNHFNVVKRLKTKRLLLWKSACRFFMTHVGLKEPRTWWSATSWMILPGQEKQLLHVSPLLVPPLGTGSRRARERFCRTSGGNTDWQEVFFLACFFLRLTVSSGALMNPFLVRAAQTEVMCGGDSAHVLTDNNSDCWSCWSSDKLKLELFPLLVWRGKASEQMIKMIQVILFQFTSDFHSKDAFSGAEHFSDGPEPGMVTIVTWREGGAYGDHKNWFYLSIEKQRVQVLEE